MNEFVWTLWTALEFELSLITLWGLRSDRRYNKLGEKFLGAPPAWPQSGARSGGGAEAGSGAWRGVAGAGAGPSLKPGAAGAPYPRARRRPS